MRECMSFIYRLFFTRDDDLDLLQVTFLLSVGYTLFALTKIGQAKWTWPGAAFGLMATVFGTLAIAGTPRWISELLAKRNESNIQYAMNRVDDPDES